MRLTRASPLPLCWAPHPGDRPVAVGSHPDALLQGGCFRFWYPSSLRWDENSFLGEFAWDCQVRRLSGSLPENAARSGRRPGPPPCAHCGHAPSPAPGPARARPPPSPTTWGPFLPRGPSCFLTSPTHRCSCRLVSFSKLAQNRPVRPECCLWGSKPSRKQPPHLVSGFE